jgi:hypothetical protein
MTPLLALDQALNFLLPAWGLALLMAMASKVFQGRTLKRVSWWGLWARLGGVNTLVSLGCLAATLHDGSMLQYALLVAGSALTVWWMSRR